MGAGSVGKKVKINGQFAKSLHVKVLNKKLKYQILNALEVADWNKEYPTSTTHFGMCSTLNIWQVIDYLKLTVPGIK